MNTIKQNEPKWKKYLNADKLEDHIDNQLLYENNFTFAKNTFSKPKSKEFEYCTRVTTTLEDDSHFETCDVKLSDILQNSEMYSGVMNY